MIGLKRLFVYFGACYYIMIFQNSIQGLKQYCEHGLLNFACSIKPKVGVLELP